MSRACLRAAARSARSPWPRSCAGTGSPLRFDLGERIRPSPSLITASSNDWQRHSSSTSTSHGSSVNASEVTHFTQLASSWWDPHGPSRLLHLMNPLRHDFIQNCMFSSTTAADRGLAGNNASASQEKKLAFLDIGCGGGIFASSAARLPTTSTVTAIDPTPEVIRVAKEHRRSDPLLSEPGRLNYINCAIEELESHREALPEGGFDFVTVFEVIEHIDQPAAFLRQAMAHLAPGGWLIGSTIARHPLSYLTTKVIAEAPWPVGVVPPGTHDWNKYINPVELKQWVVKENLDLGIRGEEEKYGPLQVQGCVYLPVLGWKFVNGSEDVGNYFFGVQKLY